MVNVIIYRHIIMVIDQPYMIHSQLSIYHNLYISETPIGKPLYIPHTCLHCTTYNVRLVLYPITCMHISTFRYLRIIYSVP